MTDDSNPSEHYLAAVKAGDLAGLDAALNDGADLYAIGGGLCAMSIAIQNGQTGVAAELLRREFNPDFLSEGHGTTPLQVACGWGRTEIAKMLIQHGANVNHIDAHNNDALCWALEYNYPEAVDLLLDQGADPRLARNYGVVLARDPNLEKIVDYFMDLTADTPAAGRRQGEKLAQTLREGIADDISVRTLRLKSSRSSFARLTL
ncbi:MAG: ankyrin repeat domain-containing protein [Alphaproteobacteria bacterium]|nr:MAG: ankyrin repeat domain-containing protein [Alphaproteobacteria bacterium]